MKSNILNSLLLLTNLTILFFLTTGQKKTETVDIQPIMRVREFELVDAKGTKRMSFKTEEDGEVVFRMLDKTGTIRLKLGASEKGSGLVMLNSETEVGIHATVKEKDVKLSLTNGDGRKQEFQP